MVNVLKIASISILLSACDKLPIDDVIENETTATLQYPISITLK
jgi:hypothetical protein